MFNEIELIWKSHEKETEKLSITKYIETNGIEIRNSYSNFIHNLSHQKIGKKKIYNYFSFNNHFNLWWMSLLYEKNFYKSKHISDCIKIIGLERIIKEFKPHTVSLICSSSKARKCIIELFKQSDVILKINIENKSKRFSNLKFSKIIKKNIPYYLQGFLFLFSYYLNSLSLKKLKKPSWNKSSSSIFLFSYFTHLKFNKQNESVIESSQWEDVIGLIRKKRKEINWLHFDGMTKDNYKKKKFFSLSPNSRQFNDFNEQHFFLESYLNILILIKIFFIYSFLYAKYLIFKPKKNIFLVKNSKINLYPLLIDDWHESFSGIILMQNIIWITLFDLAMKDIPKSKFGLFPQENQSWERAFIASWRKYQKGKLIGYAHSDIRFWDTKYVENEEIFKNDSLHFPYSDALAINSQRAYENLISFKFPQSKILKVEAVRYFRAIENKNNINKNVNAFKKLLIVGDYQFRHNYKLLDDIFSLNLNPKDYNFTFKSHPGFPIDISRYKSFGLKETNEPLEDILKDYDIIVAVDATAASIEAVLMNKFTIVYYDSAYLNYSPLRNSNSVSFVSHKYELGECIKNYDPKVKRDNSDLLYYNKDLKLWRNVIDKYVY